MQITIENEQISIVSRVQLITAISRYPKHIDTLLQRVLNDPATFRTVVYDSADGEELIKHLYHSNAEALMPTLIDALFTRFPEFRVASLPEFPYPNHAWQSLRKMIEAKRVETADETDGKEALIKPEQLPQHNSKKRKADFDTPRSQAKYPRTSAEASLQKFSIYNDSEEKHSGPSPSSFTGEILKAIQESVVRGDQEIANLSSESNIFKDFLCPITHKIMKDPVMTADGYSYERSAIAQWLQNQNTSPMTNEVLAHINITPNYALKGAIVEFIGKRQKTIEKMQEDSDSLKNQLQRTMASLPTDSVSVSPNAGQA